MLVVMKFGGTSVGSGKVIAEVAGLVKEQEGKKVVVVSAMSKVTDSLIEISERVVSVPKVQVEKSVDMFIRDLLLRHRTAAFEAVTDKKVLSNVLDELIKTTDELRIALLGVGYLGDLSPKSKDYIMSFGERLSILLVSGALDSVGVRAKPVTGFDAGIVTDDKFGCARPQHKKMVKSVGHALSPLLDAGITPVVTGFVGGTESGVTTTLGRGGSDYSASLVGRYLKAD
ncbi:putative aspartokinase [uncultured archaeon]|nr:putative aspartokinase [uncultured archaeon]